ncbi:MAG: methyl-accepting chemotaxis protein [Bdellovibrionaceae bacterium]|nr:methyl-accepting chemotaxis protein [Pseudobdellovibrionaceae bacterium]
MKISLNLNTIIIAAASVMLLLGGSVSALTLLSSSQIRAADLVLEMHSHIRVAVNDAKYHVVQIQQFLTDASLTQNQDSIEEARQNLAEFEKAIDTLKSIQPSWGTRLDVMRNQGRMLFEVGVEMTDAYWKKGSVAGNTIMQRPETGLDARAVELSKLLEDAGDQAATEQTQSEKDLAEAIGFLKQQTIVISVLLIMMTLVVFTLLYRRLRPLAAISDLLMQNTGELDEVGRSVKEKSGGLSAVTSDQAAATQQTAASLEEIRAMVARTSENAARLMKGAETSEKLVASGKDRLQTVQDQLGQISSESDRLVGEVDSGNKEILGIIGIISEIGAKTKVINDIVFQTKLLSFNASVEAARAGEHGKGFAVVAEEVGNLASMSGTASQEISAMLEQGVKKAEAIIQSNAQRLQQSVGVTKSKISQGIETATKCEESFNDIVRQVSEVKSVSDEITVAIEEQKKGLDEIGKAIASLESATQANSAASETLDGNSNSLYNAIESLTRTAADIRTVIAGRSDSAT